MELKDKIKALRQERSLTQAELAEKLYVSRSTVAKWENGLGLPNEDSMKMLEAFFGTTKTELSTTEPETVIVEKNRKLRLIGQILGWTALLIVTVCICILPFSIQSGKFGFTPEMAAGRLADNEFFDTGDFRIYYFAFEGDWDDGRHWSDLQYFKIIQKHFWGCTVYDEDSVSRVITKDNYVVGRIYSIQGKNGYYNLIQKEHIYQAQNQGEPMIWNIPAELITATSVIIRGIEYDLQEGILFITPYPADYFMIGDSWYDII